MALVDTTKGMDDLTPEQQQQARELKAVYDDYLAPVKSKRMKERALRTGLLLAEARLSGTPREDVFKRRGTVSKRFYDRNSVVRTAITKIEALTLGMGIKYMMNGGGQ